ncbi:MAG: N-acyl homoserine lactonase family protein [Emcibacter sp.]|nr:N-acyl homoserine lactonase family protein [Emcibacter sp.]
MKNIMFISVLLLSTSFLTACDSSPKISSPTEIQTASIKLYALECGRIDMLDLGIFASNKAFDGRSHKAIASCYLIRHPKGDLLWDTGLPDVLNETAGGITNGPFHISVPITLESQLSDLGLKPEDIEFLSLSHTHFDHSGNAGRYASANFIVHEAELEYMFSETSRANAESFVNYSALENAQKTIFTGEYDVFGDGSVKIIEAQGHTPGHTVLKLNLKNAGIILLTGDLYHLHEARELRTVPVFNTDEPETLRSMDKFEAIAKETKARVIIQHSIKDFEGLPKLPHYLD